jgi:hypothetical protein
MLSKGAIMNQQAADNACCCCNSQGYPNFVYNRSGKHEYMTPLIFPAFFPIPHKSALVAMNNILVMLYFMNT